MKMEGMYFCLVCGRHHRYSSRIGRKHLKYSNPPPAGVIPYTIVDPSTGEIIFQHYLETYGNYIIEHFVPSEFVKARGGIIRSVKSGDHVIRIGYWNTVPETQIYTKEGFKPKHLHYAIVEILHPLDPSKKCKLREMLKKAGEWDELMRRGAISDSFIIGYRKHSEIEKILKEVEKSLKREGYKIITPVSIPANPIGHVVR